MEHDCHDCILPKLVSAKEAASELNITKQHFTRLCRDGDIVAQYISQRWITTPAALNMYKAKPKNGRGKYDRNKPKQ